MTDISLTPQIPDNLIPPVFPVEGGSLPQNDPLPLPESPKRKRLFICSVAAIKKPIIERGSMEFGFENGVLLASSDEEALELYQEAMKDKYNPLFGWSNHHWSRAAIEDQLVLEAAHAMMEADVAGTPTLAEIGLRQEASIAVASSGNILDINA